MPLRLALMAAIGALLALGACSSDTKTVTAQPTPTTPTPDPDPDPTPDPAAVTLPAAAATAFTAPRVSFSVGELPATQGDNTVREDRYGNRFRDINGYRFTCEGAGTCSWTITRDSEGMLSIATTGGVRPGVVPSVKKLAADGVEGYLRPASGDWDSFIVAAGMNTDKNLVNLACPAGGAACSVEIEKRDSDYYLVSSGADVTLSRAQMFYDGLAYFATTNEGRSGDLASLSEDLGSDIANAARRGSGELITLSYHRRAPADLTTAPADTTWGGAGGWIAQLIRVAPTSVPSSEAAGSMKFAGFAEGTDNSERAKTYGAVQASERRLGLVVSATAANNLPTVYNRGAFEWEAELPVERADDGSFPFAGADARSSEDRWSTGFTTTMNPGAGTEDVMTDDGTLHLQVLTDYDTGAAVAAEAQTITPGTIDGLLLVASGASVPSTAPQTQTILAGTGSTGTLDGVPGTFVCSTAPCTVATSGAAQTLTGSNVVFTPTTGAQMLVDDADNTDWLAIGSWALALNDGSTSYGAFVDHGDVAFGTAASLLLAQNEYTYRGPARGHYAEYDDGTRESGVFAADARLVVDFADATNPGDVYGTLRDFSSTAHGAAAAVDRDDWSINFASAGTPHTLDFSADSASAAGFDPGLTGTWGSETGQTLVGYSWLKFYRAAAGAAYNPPTAIAGTFAAYGSDYEDADNVGKYRLSLIGAFGARR